MEEPEAEGALTAGTDPESGGANVAHADSARVRRQLPGCQVISILAVLVVVTLLAGAGYR
jgi:hypothetical protein